MNSLNGLAEKWDKLCLSEEEQDTIAVEEDIPEEVRIKEKRSLIEKKNSNRNISRETVRGIMEKFWRISKQATFTKVGENMFIDTFATKTDKQRAVSGKPWMFDGNLFTLKDLDGQS